MDAKFTEYGCIVPNIPADELMAVVKGFPLPENGMVYSPREDDLHAVLALCPISWAIARAAMTGQTRWSATAAAPFCKAIRKSICCWPTAGSRNPVASASPPTPWWSFSAIPCAARPWDGIFVCW